MESFNTHLRWILHACRYGMVQKIIQLTFMEDVVNLLEVNWYYLDAAIVDDVSKNIFLRSDMGFETSIIQAESVDGQVCIVVPVPFTARRLAKNYNSSRRTLPPNCLDRQDFLYRVLD